MHGSTALLEVHTHMLLLAIVHTPSSTAVFDKLVLCTVVLMGDIHTPQADSSTAVEAFVVACMSGCTVSKTGLSSRHCAVFC